MKRCAVRLYVVWYTFWHMETYTLLCRVKKIWDPITSSKAYNNTIDNRSVLLIECLVKGNNKFNLKKLIGRMR